MPKEALRADLLDAALRHIPFTGWSEAAFRQALEERGEAPAVFHRLFPGGVVETADLFLQRMDAAMREGCAGEAFARLRVRDKIAACVRARLDAMLPHREAARRLTAYLALHPAQGLKALYRTVDEIWYLAGDRSTDFSFYTRRMLLAGVYTSTLSVWLGDDSEGQRESAAFLARRIDNALTLGGITRKCREFVRVRRAGSNAGST